MANYSGRAVVIDQDGDEHDVRANLISYAAGRGIIWRGTLEGDAPWWDMFNARGQYVLRIGDREATVVVESVGGAGAITDAAVAGSGPVPFD